MILALAAALAIVVQDHAPLRAAPKLERHRADRRSGRAMCSRSAASSAGYLKVYNYRRERGGYLSSDAVRPVTFTEADAPELLAVLRFLRDSPGSEALGISYGAAYLKAVPARALTAEPLDAIARMAERLADEASGNATRLLTSPRTSRWSSSSAFTCAASSAMAGCKCATTASCSAACCPWPTRPPRSARTPRSASRARTASIRTSGPSRAHRSTTNAAPFSTRSTSGDLSAMTSSRLHARRAGVWASLAFEQARRGEPPAAGGRACARRASRRASE